MCIRTAIVPEISANTLCRQELIAKRSPIMNHIRNTGQVKYVYIVRDVINVLPVHWIYHENAGLPLGDDVKDEHRRQTLINRFGVVERLAFAGELTEDFPKLRDRGEAPARVSLSNSPSFRPKLHAKKPDLTEVVAALFTEVMPTAASWAVP
ncbi:hypothetical protein C8R44DRAFT_850964 [Mycena epipterygia]|nr:hypothetical protein C8R44DRAFT_850964 [Mycena epipterygia]